jgi:hypothetical protein
VLSSQPLLFADPQVSEPVRRFQSLKDSVVFVMTVFFLVDFDGSVLHGPLLWWHRELFSAEPRWAPMLGKSEKLKGIPEHKSTETHEQQNPERNSRKMRRQKISKRLLLPQKL